MMSATSSRLLLVAITLLAVFHAASAFLCYTKTMGKDDQTVTTCGSGTCFSIGGSIGDSKDSQKGCAEEAHESGCVEGGIPGIISGHTCYCKWPLCNSAYTPSIALPLLVLPALLQRLLS